MNRRAFLLTASTSLAALSPAQQFKTRMGVASTSYLSYWKPKDTLEFLEHCHALGAAGIQASITGDPAKVRARAEELGMYVEAMVALPKGDDVAAFEQQLSNAKAVNAVGLRSGLLSGRRYETFTSAAEWTSFVDRCHRSVELAVPLVEKYKIPLGIENHKDWTAAEMVALMKKYSSEQLGVCLDFGNNLSLLEDPAHVVEQLAPYTLTTHVKDMGVELYTDGFLMSEMPLGHGFLNLPDLLAVVQKQRPATRLSLEMITRDPLAVPCLTEHYWRTFPTRDQAAIDRTLALVRKNSRGPLPRFSQLDSAAQRQAEDHNVKLCLDYSRQTLKVGRQNLNFGNRHSWMQLGDCQG